MIRLGSARFLRHGFVPYSALNGPKLDLSFGVNPSNETKNRAHLQFFHLALVASCSRRRGLGKRTAFESSSPDSSVASLVSYLIEEFVDALALRLLVFGFNAEVVCVPLSSMCWPLLNHLQGLSEQDASVTSFRESLRLAWRMDVAGMRCPRFMALSA